MSRAPEWDGILDLDEEIIWQGQPAKKVRLEFKSATEPFFYIFFTGFSIFWMVMASQAPGPFWMFGLLFFGVGSYNLVGQHFWKASQRGNTFYTLTTKRAFIATKSATGKRKLDSYPLAPDTPLKLEEGELTSIYFSTIERRGNSRTMTEDVGFELLADGRDIFRKMRDVQQANAPKLDAPA